jgi:thioredoxin 1
MILLTDDKFNSVISSGDRTLVFITANWSVKGAKLTRILEEIERENHLNFYEFIMDEKSKIIRRYVILRIPTLIMFRNRVEIERISGLKTKQEILNFLERAKTTL